jgi:hypothetical protein
MYRVYAYIRSGHRGVLSRPTSTRDLWGMGRRPRSIHIHIHIHIIHIHIHIHIVVIRFAQSSSRVA